jgi:hypothetical protein
MKALIHLVLAFVGFGVMGLMVFYLSPEAMDTIGFSFFYLALIIGSVNLFLLLRLSLVQAGLLATLLTLFLLLQQFRIFSIWVGLVLVMFAIVAEFYVGGVKEN